MKSFRVRMTMMFACAAMVALAAMLAIGHQLLENRLMAGLDAMIAGHSDQIVARIAFDADTIDQSTLRRRIHEANEHLSDLIYINVTSRKSGNWVSYRSSKLLGQDIPVNEAWAAFTAVLPGIGAIRAQAVRVGPFEVVVGTPLAPVYRTMASYERIGILLLLATVFLGAAIGFFLSHIALAPIRAIAATAERVSSNDLAARIPVGQAHDELSALARLLNRMFDRLEAAFEQARGFSYDASHELKTPLTLIRLHAERMLRDNDFPAEHAEAVVVQIEEIARLDRVIDALLFLARADAGAAVLRASAQDPEPLLRAVSRDAAILSEPSGCRYSFSHEGHGQAVMEEGFIRQVLFNLLVNAIDASPPAGTITVASRICADHWQVSVEDEGPGLPPALRARMFDRFARFDAPKESDRGSGLGLAISRRMVELHGGRIYAADRAAGPGLRVVFELPAVPA